MLLHDNRFYTLLIHDTEEPCGSECARVRSSEQYAVIPSQFHSKHTAPPFQR